MNVGIIGATGLVGREILSLLDKSEIEINELVLLASHRSSGKRMVFRNKEIEVQELTKDTIPKSSILFFAVSSDIAKEIAPYALDNECVIIDNSSAFRMSHSLIVPEINADRMQGRLVANPNCSTIILTMALYPLMKLGRIENVSVATYQAASGAGIKGMEELERQATEYSETKKVTPLYFDKPYLFNCFPHNSAIDPMTKYNEEELKMINETKKILNATFDMDVTCIRIPTLRSHGEVVTVTFDREVNLTDVKKVIDDHSGIKYCNDIDTLSASEQTDILFGHLRSGLMNKNKISFFISGDQILKGAAYNAFQIFEYVINH